VKNQLDFVQRDERVDSVNPANYTIRVMDAVEKLEELRIPWDALAEKHSYSPFLSFDWFRTWMKHFLGGRQLLVLLLYRGENIRAIAPFLLKEEKYKGIPVKKIELVGNVYSPIRYFLFASVENVEREEVMSSIYQFFKEVYKQWDIIDLHPIPEENDNFLVAYRAADKSCFRSLEYQCFGNWYSDRMGSSCESYFRKKSKKVRAGIRNDYNRAKRQGELEFRMITGGSPLEEQIEIYIEVYKKSWKVLEGVGFGFLEDWMRIAAQRGWLRLGVVALDKVPVGTGFAIVHNGCAFFEKTAYDRKYQAMGPGTIWFAEMMRYLIDIDGVTTVDFLRGDEDYKKRWAEKRRERKGLVIFNKNLRGNTLSALTRHVLPVFNGNRYLRMAKKAVRKHFPM
jgi:CelD/BcsL family acetyltransferase involved in cellulose biosynthesis